MTIEQSNRNPRLLKFSGSDVNYLEKSGIKLGVYNQIKNWAHRSVTLSPSEAQPYLRSLEQEVQNNSDNQELKHKYENAVKEFNKCENAMKPVQTSYRKLDCDAPFVDNQLNSNSNNQDIYQGNCINPKR